MGKKRNDVGAGKSKKTSNKRKKVRKGPVTNGIKSTWLIIAILAFTLLCFYTSLDNDFVYWDDDRNILDNNLVNSFSWNNFWSNTVAIFSTTVIGNYNPLTIFTFGLENAVFGIDHPFYWHLDNLILHLIAVYLVFRIGSLLGLNLLGATAMALLFAVHPMRVESVAWITERKDVLYGVFFLGAMYQYILYKRAEGRKLIWMTIFFVLALFSKIQAVTFPVVMILIDYLLDRDLNWRKVWSKWPFFLMSLIVGVLGITILKISGSLEANESFPLWQRIFIGSYSFVIYLVKLLIPYKLSPLYPYPASIPYYFYLSIAIVPIYLYFIYLAWKKNSKEIVFGLLFFLVNIVMLLQVLGAGQGFLADRFTYIAYLGLFFTGSYYLQLFVIKPVRKKWLIAAGICIILIFGFMTFQQNKIWKDSDILWSHVLQYYPTSTLAFGNKANYLRDKGRYQEAIDNYNASLRIKPDQSATLNSRAKLYFSSNNKDTLLLALEDYERACSLDPDNAEYLVNKGATLGKLGRMKEALDVITDAIELNPTQLSGYSNRSVIYSQFGEYERALADITSYLSYNPNNADFWFESGNLKGILGRASEGLDDIDNAIRINSNKAVYHYRKAEILTSLNRIEEARTSLNQAKGLGYNNISPALNQRLLSK